jgi:hypothetical protein
MPCHFEVYAVDCYDMRAQAPSAYVNITDLRGQPLYLLYYKLIAAGHRELMLRILFCSTLSCTFNPIRASPVAFVASSGLVVTLLPFVLICVLSLTTVQPELTIEAQCSQKPKIPTKHAFIFEARGSALVRAMRNAVGVRRFRVSPVTVWSSQSRSF